MDPRLALEQNSHDQTHDDESDPNTSGFRAGLSGSAPTPLVELSEGSLPRHQRQSGRPPASVDEKGLASLSPEIHFPVPENRARCGLPLGLVGGSEYRTHCHGYVP